MKQSHKTSFVITRSSSVLGVYTSITALFKSYIISSLSTNDKQDIINQLRGDTMAAFRVERDACSHIITQVINNYK